jgi:chromosome partitioning protein
MPGIICCVCNHKGGVGKTSLTVNLGSALAIQKNRVLIVDNDPQANATGILLKDTTYIRNSLYELLDVNSTDKPPVQDCIYPSLHNNLYTLPNVEETAMYEVSLAEHHPESLSYLRNQIRDYAVEHFDFTFIDCPPTMGLFVVNALYASDMVLVPIDAGSSYSLDGLRKILAMVEGIQSVGNPDLRFLRLLINRVDKRTSISRLIISDVNDRFGSDNVFKTTIPIGTQFQKAEYRKETIFSHDPGTRGATAYRNLGREFLSILKSMKG